MEDFLLSLRALKSLSPAASTFQCHTRRGKLAEWLHGATHEYHVNVGSEPALGFTALTPTPSYFLHVRVSLFMCVWVFFSPPSFMFAFDAEWQGNPEPPTSSCCLYFSSPLSCSVFLPIWLQWTALWLSETVIEALRYLIHLGLRNVKRAHYAPPNLTATASGSSYPMNLFGISSVPVRERSVKGKDRMWMTFGSLRLSAGVLCVASRLQRHHWWKPGEQLCRGRHVFKRRFFFLYQDKRKTAAKTLISDKKGSQNMHDFNVWSCCTDAFCIILAYYAISVFFSKLSTT